VSIPDWKKFEQLAAAIQRELAPEARVTENAKLKGKSGSEREIDILIEQEAGQFDLRIAIDCKDYKNPVDVKDVEAFIGLVEDVAANKGAMIASNGFTVTAKSRAIGAGLDLFRLIDTANHKWQSYVSIPAVLRDFQVSNYSFGISGKGRSSFDLRQDFPYMPILRSDGSLIDYACNLVAARWEDETIPVEIGEHRDLPLVDEPTFFQGLDFRFEATIRLNAAVREVIYFGQLPIVDIRGFKSELDGATHFKTMTTAPINLDTVAREWKQIESIDQLAVKPVLSLSFKTAYPRYEPGVRFLTGKIIKS
jgi:Restriction endonuclease